MLDTGIARLHGSAPVRVGTRRGEEEKFEEV